jgi:hypothetical protein
MTKILDKGEMIHTYWCMCHEGSTMHCPQPPTLVKRVMGKVVLYAVCAMWVGVVSLMVWAPLKMMGVL